MTLGMGLVFLFLAIVILCVQGMASAIRRHEERACAKGADDGAVVAAIATAVHEADRKYFSGR